MTEDILKQSGIYCIRNILNNKVYVGSAVKFSTRFTLHRSRLNRGIHHSIKLQNSWKKNEQHSFSFEVLEIVHDKEKLLAAEQVWMDKLGACGKSGYNILPTAGSRLGKKMTPEQSKALSDRMRGSTRSLDAIRKTADARRGSKHTEDTKKKMSESAKKRVATDETRLRMSVAMTGKKFPFKKRTPLSAETKRKIGDKTREYYKNNVHQYVGTHRSEEIKRKISEAQKGKPRPESLNRVVSEETKLKISKAHKGRNLGIKLSEETKKKMSEAQKLRNQKKKESL
jgi:hypothetical protein